MLGFIKILHRPTSRHKFCEHVRPGLCQIVAVVTAAAEGHEASVGKLIGQCDQAPRRVGMHRRGVFELRPSMT